MTKTSGAIAPLASLARMAYVENAAEDSWRRILEFFGDHLRS
jgi:dienelactone hydrolase